jgi:hypothetical protein
MTKIPLTRSQFYARQALVFILAFIGTICFLIVLMALFGCGAPRRLHGTVHAPRPLTVHAPRTIPKH